MSGFMDVRRLTSYGDTRSGNCLHALDTIMHLATYQQQWGLVQPQPTQLRYIFRMHFFE